MARRNARLAVVLLGLLAAALVIVGAFLVLHSTRSQSLEDEFESDAAPIPAPDGVPLAASPNALTTAESAPMPSAAKPVGRWLTVEVVDFDKRPRPGAVVRVDVEKPARSVAEADAKPLDDAPTGLSSSADASGVASFDVSALALDGDARALSVVAATFDRLPGRARVDLPLEREGRPEIRAAFDLKVAVTLVEGALVRGSVCDEEGAPIARAHVAAVLSGFEQGGGLASAPEARSAEDGTYALVVPEETTRVGIVAFAVGRRPAALEAAISPRGVSDVPRLVIPLGEGIAGSVVGRRKADAGRVRVSYYGAARSGSGVVWESALIALCGSQPVVGTSWPVVDEKGNFRVDGLERGPHRVRYEPGESSASTTDHPAPALLALAIGASKSRSAGAKPGQAEYFAGAVGRFRLDRLPRAAARTGDWNVHPNALLASDVIADATSRSVVLSLERSTLVVSVGLRSEASESNAWVRVSDRTGALGLRVIPSGRDGRGDRGEATFVVRAGSRVVVDVTSDDGQPVSQEVDAPAPGESIRLTFDLRRRRVPVPKEEKERFDKTCPVDWKIEPPSRARLGSAGPDGVPISIGWELRDATDHVIPAELAIVEADRFVLCAGRTPWTDDGALVSDIAPGSYRARLGGHPFLYRFADLSVGDRHARWAGGGERPYEDRPPVHVEMLCR